MVHRAVTIDEKAGIVDLGKVLIVVPTYNESDNIKSIITRARASVPEAHILVADDNSPDGTGELADAIAELDNQVSVLHRTAKEGLGAAYIAGFRWGLERGYDVLVEMDADGSHQPEQLPRLLDALRDADLVLGSRYVPGGSVVNWPRHRNLFSRGANLYARVALLINLGDITAGYRAFRRRTLEGIGLDDIESQGYCFQIDMTRRALANGFRVVEVPITFVERERGHSKMSTAVIRESMVRVTSWGIQRWLGRKPRTGIAAE